MEMTESLVKVFDGIALNELTEWLSVKTGGGILGETHAWRQEDEPELGNGGVCFSEENLREIWSFTNHESLNRREKLPLPIVTNMKFSNNSGKHHFIRMGRNKGK